MKDNSIKVTPTTYAYSGDDSLLLSKEHYMFCCESCLLTKLEHVDVTILTCSHSNRILGAFSGDVTEENLAASFEECYRRGAIPCKNEDIKKSLGRRENDGE